jgi:Rps23 Pro-64 3,4-dihydroxylase Tpa1-like proline 4-hydroxylase
MCITYSRNAVKVLRGLAQNSLYHQWSPAEVSRQNQKVIDYKSRNCFTFFLDEKHAKCHPQDPITRLYASLEIGVKAAISEYRNKYELNNLFSRQWQITRYEQNNMFVNHYDDSPLFPRTVSLSWFLNDDFTGGELVFPKFDLTITPVAGQMILFPSNYPYSHSVNPVKTGIRYAAVRWYTHYESFGLNGV